MDAAAAARARGVCARACGRTHFRQPGNQARTVPRGRSRPGLADQNPGMVGAQLPFPHSPLLPLWPSGMPQSGPSAARRRLRQGARLVVHPGGSPSIGAARQAAVDDRLAGRLRQAGRGTMMKVSSHRRFGARFTWLALIALLSNAALPAVLVAAVGRSSPAYDSLRLGLCRASPDGDSPGKAKPGLLVHHCALCTAAPDILSPGGSAAATILIIAADEPFARSRTMALGDGLRNYRTQPRAPPTRA